MIWGWVSGGQLLNKILCLSLSCLVTHVMLMMMFMMMFIIKMMMLL